MSGQGTPSASKRDPAELALRARPRAVTRLNRRALMIVAGLALALVFGAAIIALDPPRFRDRTRAELYNVTNKPTAEGLSRLPSSYQDLPPRLGPPLPGDLGQAVVQAERDLGLPPPATSPPPALPFRPDPEADALRAERIRQARQDLQALESTVFFQIAARPPRDGQAAPRPGTSGLQPAQIQGAPDLPADTDGGRLELDRESDQNLQGRKLDFLNQRVDDDIYNRHPLQDPVSPYVVMAGAVIPASLVTGINSDLPGTVIAQVTEHVYDTPTGQHLLIPQGARLIGTYDSVVAFGQERALVVWRRIVMPDGSSVVIENMPATDTAGYAGLEDEVDFHTWRLLKGIALSTLLGVGTELTFGEDESELLEALRESAQSSTNRAGQRITERNLNVQPTITVRPGWPLRVIVHKDLVLRPYRI